MCVWGGAYFLVQVEIINKAGAVVFSIHIIKMN